MTGTETSTVPQCVPQKGKRERAKKRGVWRWGEVGGGGDFLFIRALVLEGFA